MRLFLCLLLLASRSCLALYTSDDAIINLTTDNFKDFTSGPGVKIVKFYTNWCGHCEELAPKFKKAATILKGIVDFGAVDMDKSSDLGSTFDVTGFPTVLIFRADQDQPVRYNGQREVQDIVNFLLDQIKEVVAKRASKEGVKSQWSSGGDSTEGTCGGSGGSAYGGGSGGSCGGKSGRGSSDSGSSKSDDGRSAVIELTESNFGELVLQSEDDWLVEFYAPWCPHCKSLQPEWEIAAKQLRGNMKLGAVDATVYQSLGQRYSIQGFPTIKHFPAGVKTGLPENYEGGRTADSIVAWARTIIAKNKPPPEVKQLINNQLFVDACTEKQLCVIAVLPHLLDCQSNCRNNYIDLLKKSAEKFKQSDWGWLWTPARAHPELESTLGIGGFGYPAMVAVNMRKQKCAVMHGSFGSAGISEYLRDLSLGRGSVPLTPISFLPELKSVSAWDGEDAPPIQEEEFDLNELNDEL